MVKIRTVPLVAVVAMCGTLVCGSPTSAETAPIGTAAGAAAQSTNPFRDVPRDDAAYRAIQQLVGSGIVRGYPNGTFVGDRQLTRYEMALIVNRAVTAAEEKMAGGSTIAPADVVALRSLVDEFSGELKDIETKLAMIDKRVDTLDHAVSADNKQLDRMRLGVTFWTRPGTFSQNVSAVAGPHAGPGGATANAPLPGVSGIAFGGGHGNVNNMTLNTGGQAQGTDWQALRIALSGNVDWHIGYQARIEQVFVGAAPTTGLSGTTPAYCMNASCGPNASLQDYNFASLPLRLNYADVFYTSPSGLFTKAGRILTESGVYNESGLVFAGGQTNGVQFGYAKNGLNAWVLGAFGNSAASNNALYNGNASTYGTSSLVCAVGMPNCVTRGTTGLLAKADYFVKSAKLDIGATFNGYQGVVNTEWDANAGLCTSSGTTTAITVNTSVRCPTYAPNRVRVTNPVPGQVLGAPITGAYVTTQEPMSALSLFAVKLMGPHDRPTFKAVVEGEKRLGNDPLTQQAWTGNQSLYAELAYASKGNLQSGPLIPGAGIRNSNVVLLDYYNIGQNGTGVEGGPYYGTTWQSAYYNNLNGWQHEDLMFDHWFNDNFRAGIGFAHWNLQDGITLPAGSPTCPGCYVNSTNSNAVFLDTYFTF